MEEVRVDRWLWSVRLFKTRGEASAACKAGHVRVGGSKAKPATPVRVGDRVEARVHGRERIVEVVGLVNTRVGAPIAAECYVDHSPPPPPRDPLLGAVPRREAGAGRPTKKDRRQLDHLRRR